MSIDSLTTRVTDHIFECIRANDLSLGEALPSELQTSNELNVSRSVVREAYHALELAGIIDKENGRSPKVGALKGSLVKYMFTHALLTKQASTSQIFELREVIEVRAAALAAHRRLYSDVERLGVAVKGMSSSLQEFHSFFENYADFHQIVIRSAGNLVIEVLGSALIEQTKESFHACIRMRNKPAVTIEIRDLHAQIAIAIERGNATRAWVLMRKHFDEARGLFRRRKA